MTPKFASRGEFAYAPQGSGASLVVRGNKTMWENEAEDSGLNAIRKNNALTGIGIGLDWGVGPSYAENRIGFRDSGQVGRQTTLPNGQQIEYKDLNLPNMNPLSWAFGKGNKGSGNGPVDSQGNPIEVNFATFEGPPQKLNWGDKGYIRGGNRPDTLNFWDTKVGKWGDEAADIAKGLLMPATIPWGIADNLLETLNPNHPDYNTKAVAWVNERFGPNAASNIDRYGGNALMIANFLRGMPGR